MRRRRIPVLVVIFIILNVAFARENDSNKSNEGSSESNEQKQTPGNEEGDNRDGSDNAKSNIAQTEERNDIRKQLYTLIHSSDDKPGAPPKGQHCKCNEGLDCKCDNSTLGNIECHCADFDNLAKLNEGYSCKCEKNVLSNIQLKCQCARKDSRQNVIKTVTCTSVVTYTQSHIRDISFGNGGKLQLYEKDSQEKKVLMTGIKDINDIIDMLNRTRVSHNFSEIIIDIKHLKEIDAVTLLKHFLYHHEFLLQHFNMCGCKNVSGVALCHCNDRVDLYTVEQPAKCLCMPIHNKWPSVECMCNEYSHEPKLLYYPQIFEIFKCTCSRSDDRQNLICSCNESANFDYEYDKILVDIRAVEEDHTMNIKTKLGETAEFKNTEIDSCNCTYAKPSWDCDCSMRTTEYKSQNNLAKCLCLDQNKNGEINQCLCSNHILEPTVLFNSEKIDMYGCACYNPNSQTKTLSLKCDCKQREDKEEKYDDVVIDISEIVNANLTHIVTYLNSTAQFYQRHIDSCKCYYEDEILICNCLAPMDSYTEENPSQCFCLQHPLSGTPNCICNPNLHSINIIYALDIEIQECLCSRFLHNTHDISCKCSKKISYTYDYKNSMIDIVRWPQYTLATILVQLLHTIQYNREHFNLCACTVENGKYSCSCHDVTKSDTISNCFCISDNAFQTSTFKYCMCNLHFHTSESVRIRYQQTDDKYIEECTCNKGDEDKSLICGKCAIKCSVHRYSEKPYKGEVHIAHTVENQLKIILNIVFKNFVQQDREINKCQCSENLQDCICEHDLRPYESEKGEMRCFCVADYYYVDRPLRCACNPRILDREIKFNERMYDIRFCYAFARKGDKNRVFCKPQRPPLPKYDFVIGVSSAALVHVHTLREYIIQARSDFDKEKFNMCHCKIVNNALECNCVENTDMYTEASTASCQCILYGEDHGVECICSPHILQFELGFYAHQTDIDGCRCYHKEIAGEKQLTCGECIRRTPLETHPRWTLDPIYNDVSVSIPDDVENQLHVIISYVLKVFKANDKVINHCQCTNNLKDCSCKYPVEPYKLEGVGHLNCLCVADFYYNEKPMQCACNPHILEPKIGYLTSKYDITRSHCFIPSESTGTGQNIICESADVGEKLDHAADRVVIDIKKSLVIHTKNIFEYIIQQHDYQHEKFTFCTCANDDSFNCSCETDTSKYTINHERNCLCIVPEDLSQNVECLCNAIVLQFGIIFEEKYDLEACRCYHSVDSLNKNQLICTSCIKRETYERNPHFIYHQNYIEKVVIKPNTDNQLSTIITHIVKQFNINDRVVNYCKCKEDLTDCMCEYPVTPYLLLQIPELNCFCVADYYYTDHPVRCGCNPYVLQPKVVYNTTKYDFRFVTCASRNNKLICEQLNKELIPGQINKIVVEVTESRITEISHFVDYILEQKGYIGEHVNICCCEENNDGYLSCNCNGPTQALTITNTGSCLCLESPNDENKRNCICNPHILQLGLIFNSKIHLEGCHCYKSIYNANSTSLTCTQCKKRETFEVKPRFDYGISYQNIIVKITEVLENQLNVVINYIFNYAKFPIQNRVINECSCEDDLSECTCNRPLLPYAGQDQKLRCFCIADYFYTTKPLQCACNPFVWQLKIEHNPSLFDLRYIDCPITQETDKNSVKSCVYLEGKPGQKPQDKVVVRIRKEVIVNIIVIMEFILRRVEYTEEKFELCKCSISNEGHYSCNCDSETETCKKDSRCSCLCVIPSASAHTEVIECMCNPRVLQFGIQFNSLINHLEGCRCYQDINKDDTKSITCDKCIRRISYEHQTRFNLQQDYTKMVVTIHPSAENQIEVIQHLIVQHLDISDQTVVYCSCTENLINCQCESPIKQFITREGVLSCFCLADYYFDKHPIRCACNPLIVQPLLIYNETKYDFKYIDCVSPDLNDLSVTCNDTHKILVTPHPVDRAVVVLKTPIKHHFVDIIEYITSYHMYKDEDFNLCSDCKYENSQTSCNCNKTTVSYNMEHMGSCLCISNMGQETECMCGPHILQIGVIFHDAKVQACRCYHSTEDKSSATSLVCRDCFDRKSFEYNPRFDTTTNIYSDLTIHIDDYIQNQIEYIYKIIVRRFTERNNQIMNFCQCLPDLETCNCKYAVEPYLIDSKLTCLCISDYYHVKYPYQCSCNPFILQPTITYDERKFEFRYLDCTLVAHSEKDVICKERPSSPKPPSAEYKLVMRLRNIEISIKIIQQYLLQNELYKYEPLISCKCNPAQGKYSCDCLNSTEVYDIHNKGYCLCITQKTESLESTECLCNSRILQFGIVYHSNSTTLSGCHCYHSKYGKDKNTLVCEQCHDIKSFEYNPHFDKEHNYASTTIAIPRYTEHQINAIIDVVFTKFNSSDQFVNHCECTENMANCVCDYSTPAYIQKNDKMPCLCVTDYFYEAHPVRCACNPFIIQPEYEYDPIKYDIRLVECTHSEESLKIVNCIQVKSKPPVATVVLDTTVWREVQIKIIEEYILSYPHYADEQFNRCGCSWNNVNNEFTCDCSEDTSKCAIENMCNCLCVTPSGSKESLGCTCNPRIFQIGYKYKSSINDFHGCRCYHSIASNRAKSLVCHSCKIVPSYEQQPHFKISFNYTKLVINITNIIIQNRIENIIPIIINHIPEIPHRLINYCKCLGDNTDCTCQYPVKSYYTKNEELNCLCITDYYYSDYYLRCGCNPFILQPSIIYDTPRYHFIRLNCLGNQENPLRMEKCQTVKAGGLPSIDQIVVDVSIERVVTMQTIITYILYHKIYKGEVFNQCTCHRTNASPLSCTCVDPTVVCTARDTCNCLCLSHSSQPENVECTCNPLSLQFGVIFNSPTIIMEACHFYHPLRDKDTRSLVAYECVKRESYDKHPHFNIDYVYNITSSIKINTITENQLSYVLELIGVYFEKRDRIFNKCQCTENLSNCICKTSIHPYLQKNHKMSCLCIADYFYNDFPLQCGCNPFMLQVTFTTLVYSTSKFDFRWLECFEHESESVKCTLVEHEVEGPASADKVVLDMTRLDKINLEIIIEHILSYTQYVKEHFNQCNCLMNNHNHLVCNCNDNTTKYQIEKRCSCLCYKFGNNANSICSCNSHILQLGIVFNSSIVEITACRCYNEHNANYLSLKCDDCRKRESFEVNPRFDLRKEYKYEVEIRDEVENILSNILSVKHRRMEFNDRIVNYCDCPEHGNNCKCAYAVEPFIRNVQNTMSCFCISDYYYLTHPLRCACNPFVTQQQLIYNSRIFDFRVGNCVANLDDKEQVTCSLKSLGNDPQYPEYKFVIKIRDLHIIDIGIIKEFLIKSMEFKYEEFNDCKCDSQLVCSCNKPTIAFNVTNKANCLCHKTSNSIDCVCNPRILQVGIVFNPDKENFLGCRCYRPRDSETEDNLLCDECLQRESFEWNPRFDLNITYFGKTVYIPSDVENQIDVIFSHIVSVLELKHQIINHCECNGNLLDCKCDYPSQAYSQINNTMPCFCITDYYYNTHPVRCRCNPYILQLDIHYDSVKYDFIQADCISHDGDKDSVVCNVRPTEIDVSTDQVILDITHIAVIHITTITEYIFSFPQFRDEKFNLCKCTRHGPNGLKCDCKNDTSELEIHNMRSCLCFSHYTNEQTYQPECICNAHILQIGIIFDSKIITWEGCRCYNPGSDSKTVLTCIQCHKIESLDNAPRFDIVNKNYYIGVVPVEVPPLTENQLVIIRQYIIKTFEKNDRFTNECDCTEDFTSCQCRNTIKYYFQLNDKMPCFCVSDYFYNDRPMRCDCNPFILQLNYKYDVTRFDFKYVECFGELEGKTVSCDITPKPHIPQPRPPADLVVFDMIHITEIDMKHIYEHIWSYPQYHDHITKCKCLKNNAVLNCDCEDVTTKATIQSKSSCLCFTIKDDEVECLCNPRILQLGIIFDSNIYNISGCRCYHSIHDYQTKTLVCDHCIPRISFSHNPRFDLSIILKYDVMLPNKTENIIANILDITLNQTAFNNRLVDYCECSEDLRDCSCKYPITPYSVSNTLSCFCVADYFYISNPIRCGCNPFVLEPNVIYGKKLYDIRHIHCTAIPGDSKKVNCVKIPGSPDPHNPEYKQVLRLRNVVVSITEIKALLSTNEVLKNEPYNLCTCHYIEGLQTCDCNDITTQFTINHQGNCLCVYGDNKVDCICNPRILQIGIVYDSEKVHLKGCRCYHPKSDEHTRSLICRNCVERNTFEMNPRFDQTINYTDKVVKIPTAVTPEMDDISVYLVSQFEERDRIVNQCECLSDYKHCKCDYSIGPYSRKKGHVMPCICMKDNLNGLYTVDCLCNPFMMQPTLEFENLKLSYAECISINDAKTDLNCTELPIKGPPPLWSGVVVDLEGPTSIPSIIHHLEDITKKTEKFNICNCTKISEENNFKKGLSCSPCTHGLELYKQNKNTSCLCVYHQGEEKNPSVECMCHNYVLQLMTFYDSKLNNLVGCECYYSENYNGLICTKCNVRPSAPSVPSFTNSNYTGVIVNIPLKAGVDMAIIRPIISDHLNGSDYMINSCSCADDFENCRCKYPPDSYARSDGNLYCVCSDDYYNYAETIQCGCNPFLWQLTYEYSKTKLDLRFIKCVTELNGKLDCVPRDHKKTTSLVVYNAKKIHLIDMNVVIEYLLKNSQYDKEDLILCSCTSAGKDKMNCKSCSSETVQYTTTEKVSCLCRQPKNARDKKPKQCVCNPFILQSEFIFNPENYKLTGCRCYHKATDKSKETLTCAQCKERESYELHPRFDLLTNYRKLTVIISNTTENEISIFLNFLVKDFKVEDQVVNFCKCTEDSKNCTCEFPVKPYLNDTKMNCFCISDYYYIEYPIRCVCNPFIFQPSTHTFNKVQDVRKSYCFEKTEGGVTCEVFSGNTDKNSVYTYVLNIRTLRVVNIGIIKEYLLKSEEYVNEPLISCDCTFKEDKKNGDKYECSSCSYPTNMYTIHNRANCLCVMPVHKTTHSRIECLCGPHILQLGVVYNTKVTDLRGCRCYGDENDDGALTCIDCIERVSFELNPHFDLQISYKHVEVVIDIYVENQIENLLSITTKDFERDHQIVNLCECTEDYRSCRCDYPVKPYSVANQLPCICILDHYFIDYPVRCGCNPYILQPKITYDDEKYILRFVECTDPNKNKENITCELNSRNVNLHLPRAIFVNLRGTVEIHIITILEYLFCYIEYQGETFNSCNCTKTNADLSCECQNSIESHAKNIMHNCLCILTGSTSSSCICNPRVQQFGIVFNSSSTLLESCRCYHSTFDPNDKTLKCHECHKRDSISEHVRFDYSRNYSDVKVDTIYNIEVHIETIVEIFVRVFNSTDQIVNYCKCKENSESCICDYPITNYLIPSGELHCICIDDFYDNIYPVRCGCNPFVTQPISSYNISQFSKEPNYFNFRQFICVQSTDAYIVKCSTLAYDHSLDTSVVSLQHLQHINIEIIQTYFLMKRTEKYNLCNCEYNQNGKLTCNHCSDITTQCSIKNPCNCFCIKDKNPKCLCNPRVLQFSLRFQSNVEYLGCRCYHSTFHKQSNRTLQCNECLNRVSIEHAPRFDIHVSYRHLTIVVPATLERRIDSLIALIISKFQDVYQVVLNCLCTKDSSPDCTCDYPYSVYAFDGVLNCLCMEDNTNPKYGLRCACNPYILHPSLSLDNWKGIDVTRMNCSSTNAESTNVHCEGTKVPPYDVVVKIPSVPIIHIQYILEIIQRIDVFKNQPFTLCDCQQTKNKSLDCNCKNNTMGYTIENQYKCLCAHNLKSELYRPVIECLCNAHIHQPRLTFDESVVMIDKCDCYNDGRYENFLKCSCRKTSSYKIMYHNNYGHVTVELPKAAEGVPSAKRLEQVRDTIIQKFAPEDKDYSHCRCMENMETCTCAKSIQEYSYKTVTPCVCLPDHLNKTYPLACVCNRHLLQPKVKFDSSMYDLRDCDCFEHHGDMTNVTCHCNKKLSYETLGSNHNYSSSIIEIASTVQKRIESVSRIILKTFEKEDQKHNYCFCTEELDECKCVDPIMSYFYYSALPCFCMDEDLMDYPVRCMCNRHILEPSLKFDSAVFRFRDCYFTLQHGDTIYPRCVETTNPHTRPSWLNEINFFGETQLQMKDTIETKQIVTTNMTLVGDVEHQVVPQ